MQVVLEKRLKTGVRLSCVSHSIAVHNLQKDRQKICVGLCWIKLVGASLFRNFMTAFIKQTHLSGVVWYKVVWSYWYYFHTWNVLYLTGSMRAAQVLYLSYSWSNFEVFCPTGYSLQQWGEIWRGGVVHLHQCRSVAYAPKLEILWTFRI